MPYATVVDVANRTAWRGGTYTATSVPNASQVIEYIVESAGQIDTWFYGQGYAAPFDSAIASGLVATQAQIMLKNFNVTGAALMIEDNAQVSDRRKDFEERWEDIRKQIFDTTWDFALPKLGAKAYPRGFGVGAGPAAQPPGVAGEIDISPRVRLNDSPGNGTWDL